MIIKLTKPITAHDESVQEIDLREPTGREIIEIGFPFLVIVSDDDTSAMQIQTKTVAKYISVLGKIPPSSVHELCGADISALMGVVMSFFGVEAAT